MKNTRFRRSASLLLALLIALAAGGPLGAAPIVREEMTGSSPMRLATEQEEYRLGKYDIIDIAIFGLEEETRYKELMIGPDGYISLPLAGRLKIGGLTFAEAQDLLRSRLAKYLVVSDLTVIVKKYAPREVYVMGEVKNPGIYKIDWDRMTLMAAISGAGGITFKGRPKHVMVVRLEDGKAKTWEINFENLVRKADMTQNILLRDSDLIYVPKAGGKIDFYSEIVPILQSIYFVKQTTKD